MSRRKLYEAPQSSWDKIVELDTSIKGLDDTKLVKKSWLTGDQNHEIAWDSHSADVALWRRKSFSTAFITRLMQIEYVYPADSSTVDEGITQTPVSFLYKSYAYLPAKKTLILYNGFEHFDGSTDAPKTSILQRIKDSKMAELLVSQSNYDELITELERGASGLYTTRNYTC